jgi:hypothetical protein
MHVMRFKPHFYYSVMLEGEKHGGPVVIGGDNLPSPVVLGLTDLPNIGPPGSGITAIEF